MADMKEDKGVLSKRLYNLIYNPELIPDWRELPVHFKISMFRNYFLLLNKTFQEEFGEQLDKWFTFISAKPDDDLRVLHSSLWPEKNQPKCICERTMLPKSGREKLVQKFNPYFLSQLIKRNPENKDCWLRRLNKNRTLEDMLYSTAVFEVGKKLQSPVIEHDGEKEKEIDIPLKFFQEYRKKCRKGDIPEVVYLGAKLYMPIEQLIEDFKKIVVELQEKYFKNHPEDRTPEFGHIGYKEDKYSTKRMKSFPFDEWERYYKVYVMFVRGKKQREIAKQFFPNDAVGSGEAKISQDIKKAKKLINNAWEGDFPGKYY